MRGSVGIFATAMENKLKTKDDEYSNNGWLSDDCSVEYLYDRLIEEVKEAKEAMDDCNPEELTKECVDIGNFAMMIFDRIKDR